MDQLYLTSRISLGLTRSFQCAQALIEYVVELVEECRASKHGLERADRVKAKIWRPETGGWQRGSKIEAWQFSCTTLRCWSVGWIILSWGT